MIQRYLDALKEHIRRAEPVKKEAALRAPKWTKSCYERLSDLIAEVLETKLNLDQQRQMGISISSKTLANFFAGDYRIGYPIDPRSLTTLTKLAIFSGLRDWNDLVEKTDHADADARKSAKPEDLAALALRQAIDLEFQAYAALPAFDPKKLESHFTPRGSAIKKSRLRPPRKWRKRLVHRQPIQSVGLRDFGFQSHQNRRPKCPNRDRRILAPLLVEHRSGPFCLSF